MPARASACGDVGVARRRRGLVVAVREHGARRRARARAPGSRRARARGARRARRRARASAASSSTTRLPDELDAAVVAARQRVEDLAVEHERAIDRAAPRQRVIQRGVVEVAQVAPEPDQRAAVADVSGGHERESAPCASARRVVQCVAGRAGQAGTCGSTGMLSRRIVAATPTVYNWTDRADTLNLTHHFLIAMPAMADPHFAHTLTYICEHNKDGALGIVVNKPIDMTLSALFEQIDVPLADDALRAAPVHFGGPVQVDRGFVLHRPLGNWQSTLAISDDLGLTTSKDVLEAVGRGDGPRDVLRVARLRRLVRGPARARARAERVAHGRGRRRPHVRDACGAAAAGGDAAPRHRLLAPVRGRRARVTRDSATPAPRPCSHSISARGASASRWATR